MCMGLPMCITERRNTPAGHAWAHGRGESRLVNTALVGDCAPGEWVLVFLDSAQERLSPERAAEIDATLDLVAAAMRGHELTNTEAAFVLPSAMNTAQLAELTGQTS